MANIVVYDLETTGINKNTVFPVQFAAIVVDGISLKIKDKEVFNQMCRPPDFDNMCKDNGLLEFHSKHRGISKEEFIKLVDSSPPMDVVFSQFLQFIGQYKFKGKDPVLGGFNIVNYDNPILERLLNGKKGVWNPIFFLDAMQICYTWLRGAELRSMSLDSLREYFGLTKGGHEALKDCKDSALILTRFLGYHNKLAVSKDYFAGAFKG